MMQYVQKDNEKDAQRKDCLGRVVQHAVSVKSSAVVKVQPYTTGACMVTRCSAAITSPC